MAPEYQASPEALNAALRNRREADERAAKARPDQIGAPRTSAASPGQQIGGYELLEPIGAGGMGEVWLARHALLRRLVAIKLMRPDTPEVASAIGAETALKRFAREAQATGALRSPHTIEVYDFGTAADGTWYYAMELLDGLSLATLVERFGPLPPERVVYLLRQVCDSLSEAHQRGFIHRDIKPSNIFTCKRGLAHDFVKVLDFGLVKAVSGEGTVGVDRQAIHLPSGDGCGNQL